MFFSYNISEELQQVAHLWNTHVIRRSRNTVAPNGCPILMYTIPHLFRGQEHLKEVSQHAVEACKQECQVRGPYLFNETAFHLLSCNGREVFTLTHHDKWGDGAVSFLKACVLKGLENTPLLLMCCHSFTTHWRVGKLFFYIFSISRGTYSCRLVCYCRIPFINIFLKSHWTQYTQ